MRFEEYTNKTIFITGAASGIGYAQALAFLENGANVFGFDIEAQGLVQLQQQYPEHFAYMVGSVCSQQDVEQSYEAAISSFTQIDILCNTAGILDGFAKTLDTDEALWDKIMNTNVKGTFFVTNKILPHMVARGAGTIAGGGGAAYTASKHAIVGYTKQLDLDYCRAGIRANAIAPGAIQTPMNQADFEGDGEMAKWVAQETPAGRWAQPQEVANLTLFLASSAADYMHGTVLPIDGGWLTK